jgi:hypothetical protein
MIKAVGDFVIIEPIIQEKVGIIFIPDQAKKEVSNSFGIVISVGPENSLGVKPEDKVFFRKNEGTVIEEKYICLASKWIVGVEEGFTDSVYDIEPGKVYDVEGNPAEKWKMNRVIDFFGMKIDVRISNILEKNGILSPEMLANFSARQLLQWRGLGNKSLEKLKTELAKKNMFLRPTVGSDRNGKLPEEVMSFIISTGELLFGPSHFKGRTAWECELLKKARVLYEKYK